MSKSILRHPLVREVNLAAPQGICECYKYEVGIKGGYRMAGYDTHWINVKSVKDFYSMVYLIEKCPEDCHCHYEREGL